MPAIPEAVRIEKHQLLRGCLKLRDRVDELEDAALSDQQRIASLLEALEQIKGDCRFWQCMTALFVGILILSAVLFLPTAGGCQ